MAASNPTLSTLTPNSRLSHKTFDSYKLDHDAGISRISSFGLSTPALSPGLENNPSKSSRTWNGRTRNALFASDEFGGAFYFNEELEICFVGADSETADVLVKIPKPSENSWPTLCVPSPGFLLACDGEGECHLIRWTGGNAKGTLVRSFRVSKERRPTELLDAVETDKGLEVLWSFFDTQLDEADKSEQLSGERPGLGAKGFRAVPKREMKKVFGIGYALVQQRDVDVEAWETLGVEPVVAGYLEAGYGGEQGAFVVVSPCDYGDVEKMAEVAMSDMDAEAEARPDTPSLDAAKDPEQPTLLSHLEAADLDPSPPPLLLRFQPPPTTLTHKNNCAGHSLLAPGLRSHSGIPPELLLSYGTEGLVYSLTPGSAESEHLVTFPALSYVSSSKREKKFLLYSADYAVWCVVERARLVFLYATPDSGARTSAQSIADLSSFGTVLGVVQLDADTLAILKEKGVYLLTLKKEGGDEGGVGWRGLDEMLDRTGDTALQGMMGDY
jgi:hypothetical protein